MLARSRFVLWTVFIVSLVTAFWQYFEFAYTLAELDLPKLLDMIKSVRPVAVEAGLENYTSFLPKPSQEKCRALLISLADKGIPVQVKDSLKKCLEVSVE
jgi:hypothetical protein